MADRIGRVEELFQQNGGVLRVSEALAAGVSRRQFYALRDARKIAQLSRGVYRLAALPSLSEPDLVTVARRVPGGVVCLISALAFHELTTQVPHSVHLAIRRGAEAPRVDYPPVTLYWFSGVAFSSGVQTHTLDGQRVSIYGPEKSVADAFKYRNKLGTDLAVEALKAWYSRRGRRVEALMEQARACRVERVIRPYLEALG